MNAEGKLRTCDLEQMDLVALDKVITALQKSWKKMTPTAHAEALKLSYAPREKALIEAALNSS